MDDATFSGFNRIVVSIVVADNLVVGSSLAVFGLSLMSHTVNLWQKHKVTDCKIKRVEAVSR